MNIHDMKTKPNKILNLMIKDRCVYPSVASAVFHFADTCEASGAYPVAAPYWLFLEKILEGKVDENFIRDFIEDHANGDRGYMAQYLFLLDVDQQGRERYLSLDDGKRKTFIEMNFNMGQQIYANPDQMNATWALSVGLPEIGGPGH